MFVEITEEGIVFCGKCVCDPIGLWKINQHCDNCPILDFAVRFRELCIDDLESPIYKGDGNNSKAL